MNSNTIYRQSLDNDPSSIDNITESLFYRMLSLGMENNIDDFLDLVDISELDGITRPALKHKLWHRVHFIGIRP